MVPSRRCSTTWGSLVTIDPENKFRLFSIDPMTKAAAQRVQQRDHCDCLRARTKSGSPSVPSMHENQQDFAASGWIQTVALIRATAVSCATVLEPSSQVPWEHWMTVVTLPAEIALLSHVKEVRLYGSHLRRVPTEIGLMTALEDLDLYTSYSLHWLPYEVVRCVNLRKSRISTRALYGNRNTRLPFPRLSRPSDAAMPTTCSVCDRVFGESSPQLLWTTQRIGTDVVPLLVHSCSRDCTLSVPTAPQGYCERPHRGGGGVGMPTLQGH
jgi:hypothetical protein